MLNTNAGGLWVQTPGRDMSVLGALVEDGDDLGQVSSEYCISYKYCKEKNFYYKNFVHKQFFLCVQDFL